MLRFFKDFIIYGMAPIIGKIIAIFLMPIYTNILTREEYGAMAMITAVSGVIDLISNLNIHSGIARDYYEKGVNRKKLISTGFFSILTISSLVFVFMSLTSNYWVTNVLNISDYRICFIVMLLSVPTNSLASYFSILTRFKKKPILYTIGSIIQIFIQVSIALFGVVYLRAGIISIFIGSFIASIFSALYNYTINRNFVGFKYDFIYLKRALLFSIPTLPAILAGWIDSSAGQILIGKYVSMTDLGVYSVALSLASVFTLISVALQNVWSPFLYENYDKPKFEEEVRSLFLILVIFLVMITIGVSLLSKEIILLLSNSGYLQAGRYLSLLCIPMCLYLLFPIVSSGVSISRDTKYIGLAYVSGSVFNVASLFILLRFMGVIAVPISLALSRYVSYMILYTVTKRKGILILPNNYITLLIIASLLSYGINTLELSLPIRLIIILISISCLSFILDKKFEVRKRVMFFINKKF